MQSTKFVVGGPQNRQTPTTTTPQTKTLIPLLSPERFSALEPTAQDYVPSRYVTEYVQAISATPQGSQPPYQPAAAANPGEAILDSSFRVRELNGTRTNISPPCPQSATIPAALDVNLSTVLDADGDTVLGDLKLMPTVAPFFGSQLEMTMRRLRDATSPFYRSANVDDFSGRVYPLLCAKQYRGDLRTMFVKLWGYAFAAAQVGCTADPGDVFAVRAGMPAPIVEGAAPATAAFDGFAANNGPLDALFCTRRYNLDDLRIMVEAVGPYPRYIHNGGGLGGPIPRAFGAQIPGGTLTYHFGNNPPALPWVERAALGSYRQYAGAIAKWSQALDAQDEALHAFELAVNLFMGNDVQEAIATARDPMDSFDHGRHLRLYMTAAYQTDGAPLPAPAYSRLTMHPLMAAAEPNVHLQNLCAAPPTLVMRGAVLMGMGISYATGHACALFGLHGRALTRGQLGSAAQTSEVLLGQAAGTGTPRTTPPFTAVVSHIMRKSLSLGLTLSNARYICIGADDVVQFPGPYHASIWGKAAPNRVRTHHLANYLRALPVTAYMPFQGIELDKGAGGRSVYTRTTGWAVPPPGIFEYDQVPNMLDDAAKYAHLLTSAIAYATSYDGVVGGALHLGQIESRFYSPLTIRNAVKVFPWVADPELPGRWPAEGSVLAYSHKKLGARGVFIDSTDNNWITDRDGRVETYAIINRPARHTGAAARPRGALGRLGAIFDVLPPPAPQLQGLKQEPGTELMPPAQAAPGAPAPAPGGGDPLPPAQLNAQGVAGVALEQAGGGAAQEEPRDENGQPGFMKAAAFTLDEMLRRNRGPNDRDDGSSGPAAPSGRRATGTFEKKGFGEDPLRMDKVTAQAVLKSARTAYELELAGERSKAETQPATGTACAAAIEELPHWAPEWMRRSVVVQPETVDRIDKMEAAGVVSKRVRAAYRFALAPKLCDEDDYRALGITRLEESWDKGARPVRRRLLSDPVGRRALLRSERRVACDNIARLFERADKQEEQLMRFRLYDALRIARATEQRTGRPIDATVQLIFQHLGSTNEVHATGLVMYAALMPGAHRVLEYAARSGILALDRLASVKAWKSVTMHVTRTMCTPHGQPLTTSDMREWCYMHMLIGRSGMSSDWDAELEARMAPHYGKVASDPRCRGLMTSEEYRRKYSEALDEVFTRMYGGGTVVDQTLQDHWDCRHAWTSRGSAARIPVPVPLPEGVKERLHKAALFETLPHSWLRDVVRGPPQQLAGMAEKYEPGSNRALYAVLSTHFSVFAYVLGVMEGGLTRSGISDLGLGGLDEVAAQRARYDALKQAVETGHDAFMYDYDNQNGQESPWEQAEVIAAARRAMQRWGVRGKGATDYLAACKWIEDSFDDMRIAGSNQRIVYGLFSGLRGTSWINTFVNYAWFKVARADLQQQGGIDPVVTAVHNGDDVWAVTRGRADTVRLKRHLDEMGVIGQDAKCMVGRRGEFLRLMYDPKDEAVVGYPVRALSSFVSPSFQTDYNVDALTKALALIESEATLVRRGACTVAVRVATCNAIARTCKYRDRLGESAVSEPLARALADGHVPPPEYTSRRADIESLPSRAVDALIHQVGRRLPEDARVAARRARREMAEEVWAGVAGPARVRYLSRRAYDEWASRHAPVVAKLAQESPKPVELSEVDQASVKHALTIAADRQYEARAIVASLESIQAAASSAAGFGTRAIFDRLRAHYQVDALGLAMLLRNTKPGAKLLDALNKLSEHNHGLHVAMCRDASNIKAGGAQLPAERLVAPEWRAMLRTALTTALSTTHGWEPLDARVRCALPHALDGWGHRAPYLAAY